MADLGFVISQVGEEGSPERVRADEIFDFVVKPVLESKGLRADRSDRDPTPGQITTQIVESLTTARVVVADLTGRNPNVFYELGIAHSFAIPVVSLVDSPDSLPFDLLNARHIVLGSERLGMAEGEQAKQRLGQALDVVLADGYQPRSLVTEAAQARSLDALAPDNPVAEQLADMRSLLESVNKQTSNLHRYRDSANFMFDVLRKLGGTRAINKGTLARAGVKLEDAPTEFNVNLREQLEAAIPDPPAPAPPVGGAMSDDDIPF